MSPWQTPYLYGVCGPTCIWLGKHFEQMSHNSQIEGAYLSRFCADGSYFTLYLGDISMSDDHKFCTDRVLPTELARKQDTVRLGGGMRAIVIARKLWITGSTLRVRFIGGTAEQRALAKEQALWWTQFANLTFDFNDAADAEIRVSFDASDGAWSYIGTDNPSEPSNHEFGLHGRRHGRA